MVLVHTGLHGIKKDLVNITLTASVFNHQLELRDYLKRPIYYSTEQIQKPGQVICGHLCLHMLKHLSRGKQPQDIINELL